MLSIDSFIVLYLVTGQNPMRKSSPKESVSCVSCRLVLIVLESFRLIFIVLVLLVIVVVQEIKHSACQFLFSLLKQRLDGFRVFYEQKKAGIPLP
ncbi:hypothetical protein K5Q02_09900 [Pseudomonas sp. MM211]|uniref:hypothetical protein n=1 Tax=Pseudomonas sp. MM211 TaxID=2866808 RepID=UPI001CED0305|nr:hypothetical protein [Pseudomonas sp. MM211]UCJ18644.1 hypothetical protein K5Q02_09900 [Pseudomonas sp. MM211]